MYPVVTVNLTCGVLGLRAVYVRRFLIGFWTNTACHTRSNASPIAFYCCSRHRIWSGDWEDPPKQGQQPSSAHQNTASKKCNAGDTKWHFHFWEGASLWSTGQGVHSVAYEASEDTEIWLKVSMLWKVESGNSQMSVFRAHTLCMEPAQRASVHICTWLDPYTLPLSCDSVFQKELSVVCFPLGSTTYGASATMKVWLAHILRFKR